VHPSASDRDPSPLHRGLPDIIDHASRVRRPAVRRSWLRDRHASDTAMRGVDPFVEIPWDEALDLVAGEIERVRRDHGNPSIFAGSYGWASAGRLHHPRTLLRRLLNLVGGFTDHVGDYSRGAALVVVPRVVGTQEYREKFIDAMGLEPFDLGPEELASFLQKDRAKYAERVKNANVRLD
jgi:biotin/methionine sulfoxide reductase